MKRLLIIAAAGRGSRLRSPLPKVLFPVAGRPMIDHLFELYAAVVDAFLLVLHPSFERPVRRHCAARALDVDYALQERPTGMLDALLCGRDRARRKRPRQVWITWCDQIAVQPRTIAALARCCARDPESALIFPTVIRPEPYIHLVRDAGGGILGILQRREGDPMPARGESDMGLFALSARAYFELLPEYARGAGAGGRTGERHFLPFIPWLRGRARVRSLKGGGEIESVGVNDAADLRRLEGHLRHGH